jgi:hypothetical protein
MKIILNFILLLKIFNRPEFDANSNLKCNSNGDNKYLNTNYKFYNKNNQTNKYNNWRNNNNNNNNNNNKYKYSSPHHYYHNNNNHYNNYRNNNKSYNSFSRY